MTVYAGQRMPFSYVANNPDVRAQSDSNYPPPRELEYWVTVHETDITYIQDYRIETTQPTGFSVVRIAPQTDEDRMDLFFRTDYLRLASNLSNESSLSLSTLRNEIVALASEDGHDAIYVLTADNYYAHKGYERIVHYSIGVAVEACAYIANHYKETPVCLTDCYMKSHLWPRSSPFTDLGFHHHPKIHKLARLMNLRAVRPELVLDAARAVMAEKGRAD